MEELKFWQDGVKKLVDKCEDINLLIMVGSLLVKI